MRGVLLLGLLGSCWSLEPGLEYQYRYSGRVASGIPDLKDQYSGAGIQIDVTVQVSSEHETFFQFSNIQVGEFHDELECDTRSPLPIQYHPLEQGNDLLEKPFEFCIDGGEGKEYLKAPQEPVWITNIRKSVVNIFRIPPILGNYGDPRREPTFKKTTFTLNETVMAGYCNNQYSLFQLPKEQTVLENQRREAVVEIDTQRQESSSSSKSKFSKKTTGRGGKKSSTKKSPTSSKSKTSSQTSSAFTIEDTLWSLTRVLEFESCENLVKWKMHGNKKTDENIIRTSIGNYLLRGSEGSARIERAVVEGTISVFTSEQLEEHIVTFTNQTLELRAVRTLRAELGLDYEPHQYRSWHYQVDHLLTDPEERRGETRPNLEHAATGVPITSQLITEIKTNISRGLVTLATRLTTSPYSRNHLVKEVSALVAYVTTLSRTEIHDVFNHIPEDEFQLKKIVIFYELLINAGTLPSLSYLLDKMNDPTFREDYNIIVLNFFETIHKSMKNPLLIPDVMNLVKSLSWETSDKYVKPFALLNFATLAHDLCLSPSKWEQFSENTCDPQHTCSHDLIINGFFPTLVQGVQDEDSPTWMRLVYLKALDNLGTPQAVDVIKHIVLGDRDTHISLRINAILSLTPNHLPEAVRSTVFQLLMPVFENIGEDQVVRSVAFTTMHFWEPSATWWKRVALSTWYEPSSQVASLISATITSLAHSHEPMSKIASHVLHLAKPPATPSLSHSSLFYIPNFLAKCEAKTLATLGWFANTENLFPAAIILRLKMNAFFGFSETFMINIGQLHFDHAFRINFDNFLFMNHKMDDRDIAAIARDMYEELKEELVINLFGQKNNAEYWLGQEEGVHFLSHAAADNPTLLNGIFVQTNLPHIQRYVDYTEVLPTDLGLPFFVQYVQQHAFWLQEDSFSAQGERGKVKGSINFIFDCSQDSTLLTKTLLPWSQRKFAVGAGLHNSVSVVVPLKIHGNLDMTHKEVHITIEPTSDDKVRLIDSHNYPFTVVTGPFPTTVYRERNEYKIVETIQPELFSRNVQELPSVVGLSLKSSWSANFEYPLNVASVYSGVSDPFTPSYNNWKYILEFDPAASTTKSITFIFRYVTMESDPLENIEQGLGQVSQTASDFSDYSQTPSDYQEFGETEIFAQEQQSESRQRIAKLQEQVMPISGGYVQSVSVGVELQGSSTSRSYEAVVTWATSSSSSHKSNKIQVTFLQNAPMGLLEEPHSTCLNLHVKKPSFQPLATTEEVLSTNFHTTIQTDVYDGVSCDDEPVLEIQGSLDVSEGALRLIQEKLSREDCDREAEHLLPTDIINSPIYDQLHGTVKWTQDFPQVLTNLSYYVADLLHFVYFPHISSDHTTWNPNHQIELDGTQDLETSEWDLRITRPREVTTIHGKPPAFSEMFIVPATVTNAFNYYFVSGRETHHCVVDTTTVRTFNGNVGAHDIDTCWTTLTFVYFYDHESYDVRESIFMVRFDDDEWHGRLFWPWAGLLIEMTKSSILVNGEPPEGLSTLFKFVQEENAALLKIKGGYFIKISDKVEILQPQTLRGRTYGVCGTMNGDKTHDLIGPTGCVYTDSVLHSQAWMSSAPSCNTFKIRSKKKLVIPFQETCSRDKFIPTGISHPNVIFDCTDWRYQDLAQGDYRCKAIIPTPSCKPGCKATSLLNTHVTYDCFMGRTQQELEQTNFTAPECHPHKFAITYPASCVPQ
ncbi:hemolymph clottable protein-like [Homarus americanus]|uniref:hemolymph clottable protein-like n=1 Tax=Homarus americanus TaxID=6706 RepID=UPI001C4507D4|nr:hemolymph clottable protein-like [Homarus americanus]